MQVFHSEAHRQRAVTTELSGGQLVAPFECAERVEHILAELEARGRHGLAAPGEYGMDPILAIHDADYVSFLQTCWEDWVAAGNEGEAIPSVWPCRRMNRTGIPTHIEGRLGHYALAAETSIGEGTWEAALGAAALALSGAAALAGGARGAFALCRPPGHHAAQDMFGGYCFLNNAAIAAEALRAAGMARVAVLDVDFHHGNGTQAIFYGRGDVFFGSIHGHPDEAFPHFLGLAEEIGSGEGAGCNANWPLARGTGYGPWREALVAALGRITAFGAEALVVSLGTDTFKGDPISFFTLETSDFTDMGRVLAGAGLPTLFVMEGGYAVAEIGVNVCNTLDGFEGAA